jgi:hypothetical protein
MIIHDAGTAVSHKTVRSAIAKPEGEGYADVVGSSGKNAAYYARGARELARRGIPDVDYRSQIAEWAKRRIACGSQNHFVCSIASLAGPP